MSENDQENPDFGQNGQNSQGSAAKNELEELIDSVSRLQNERVKAAKEFVINREFRFKADSPGCRLLVDQRMDFPLADHDDGRDALEMCLRLPRLLCPEREKVYSVPMSWFLSWWR
jgi:hypothetical protein